SQPNSGASAAPTLAARTMSRPAPITRRGPYRSAIRPASGNVAAPTRKNEDTSQVAVGMSTRRSLAAANSATDIIDEFSGLSSVLNITVAMTCHDASRSAVSAHAVAATAMCLLPTTIIAHPRRADPRTPGRSTACPNEQAASYDSANDITAD